MLARALAATPWGIEARPVQVEVDVQTGLPQIQIVGLPDAAVRESRERVRSALRNYGFDLPPRAVTINLAPADLRKEGNHLDLAIALSLLAAHGALPDEALAGRLFCGELGLDGGVRPVRGALAIADLGSRMECRELLLPAPNAGEAAATGSLPVLGIGGLSEAIAHLLGAQPIAAAAPAGGWEASAVPPLPAVDFADVRGQEGAKRALEVAAAGGHNLLLMVALKFLFPDRLVEQVVVSLSSAARLVEPRLLADSTCRDHADIPILGTALAGGAELLVRVDNDLLDLRTYESVDIIRPREFWNRVAT